MVFRGGLANNKTGRGQGKKPLLCYTDYLYGGEAAKRGKRAVTWKRGCQSNPKKARDFRSSKAADSRAPSFVPVKDKPVAETSEPARPRTRPHLTASAYRIETDSLNMLMNQVLEQMEKGPVNLNIIARIKAHPLYDTRPMVKVSRLSAYKLKHPLIQELLESIIAAQPEPVQQQTSRVVEQQSQVITEELLRVRTRRYTFLHPMHSQQMIS